MTSSEPRSLGTVFVGVVLAQILVFIISLPGLGIETRKPSDYAAWAGPIFLGLTLLVFALGIAALALLRSRVSLGLGLGAGQAIAAVTTNLFDISHVGGPPPPPGPLLLAGLSIVLAIATVVSAVMRWPKRREGDPSA